MSPAPNPRAICAFSLLALSACGSSQQMRKGAEAMPAMDVVELAAPAPAIVAPAPAPPAPSRIPISLPQIAYSYRYGFLVPAGALEATQKAHVAACDRLGPVRCQIVTMSRSGTDAWETGELHLKVDAAAARGFGQALEKAVSGRGGEMNESGISAEDLSKQIIDTDARVKAKTMLAQRLTQLLATRQGTTADLVAAERALSDVQEELDSARTQLAEMKGRVAMSDINISYATRPTAGGSVVAPLRAAFTSAGETFGGSIAALVRFLIIALPWALALWGGIKLFRVLGGRFPRLRRPWRKRDAAPSEATPH